MRLPPLVLAYHGLTEVPPKLDPPGLFVSPRGFERHLARLRSWQYRLVTFGEIAQLAAERRADGCAAITFDDGLADNLALVRLGIPATVFAVSGWLDGEHPEAPGHRVLSGEELRTLADAGIEIGGHTRSHPDLTTLTEDDARTELQRGKNELEDVLARPVDVAAYPYGRADAATRRACQAAGFKAACRISGEGSWTDPLNLPRQNMHNSSGVLTLRLKRDDRYMSLMRLLPARAARRLFPALR